jgi:hypothetical protein
MAFVQVDSSKDDFSIYKTWLLLAALLFGVGAQFAIGAGQVTLGIAGYGVALISAVVGAGMRAGKTSPPSVLPTAQPTATHLPHIWRSVLIVVALGAALVAFEQSSGNLYRPLGVVAWLLSIVCWALAWADFKPRTPSLHPSADSIVQPNTSARAWTLALLVVILALGAWFRYADLNNNPREMNSDQAEKLLDVDDVLNGTPYIFFERNTGREPWQFYWTVALIKLFNLRPDFMALKLGTSLIGWLMLPALFLLAREMFNTRIALIATLFAAVASWGVITARFGLRYPLAPCAVAWTMYFFVRGLRRTERNSMLWGGIWMGIGLQGYTAYRFMVVVAPVLVLGGMVGLWLQRRPHQARAAFTNGLMAAVLAALVMLPLLRYGTEHPDNLFYRAATRLGDAEQQIRGNPLSIFADNVKNVLLMFNYTHDEVWVANLPDRPALDPLLGALLVLGVGGCIVVSVRQRNPWPIALLASGVLMLIPSALSIAFPHENPSVVRTGGALPLLMIVCAMLPGMLLTSPPNSTPQKTKRQRLQLYTVWGVITALCALVIAVNFQRVFVDYPVQYCPRAQNASDIAHEMDVWVNAGHSRDNAWLVGYPYWVDTRAVGVWIGDINFPNSAGLAVGDRDPATIELHGQPGWFALNENDAESVQALKRKYPQGQAWIITGSQCAEKRFIVFTTQ